MRKILMLITSVRVNFIRNFIRNVRSTVFEGSSMGPLKNLIAER